MDGAWKWRRVRYACCFGALQTLLRRRAARSWVVGEAEMMGGRGGEGREERELEHGRCQRQKGPGRAEAAEPTRLDSTRLARTHQPGSRHSGRSVPHLSGRAGAGSGSGSGRWRYENSAARPTRGGREGMPRRCQVGPCGWVALLLLRRLHFTRVRGRRARGEAATENGPGGCDGGVLVVSAAATWLNRVSRVRVRSTTSPGAGPDQHARHGMGRRLRCRRPRGWRRERGREGGRCGEFFKFKKKPGGGNRTELSCPASGCCVACSVIAL